MGCVSAESFTCWAHVKLSLGASSVQMPPVAADVAAGIAAEVAAGVAAPDTDVVTGVAAGVAPEVAAVVAARVGDGEGERDPLAPAFRRPVDSVPAGVAADVVAGVAAGVVLLMYGLGSILTGEA